MKKVIVIVLWLVPIVALGQSFTAGQRDSLMNVAEKYRAERNFRDALEIYDKIGDQRSKLEIAETHLEIGLGSDRRQTVSAAEMTGNYGRITSFTELALAEAKVLADDGGYPYREEAELLVGRCRESQGFTSAAKRIYRRLSNGGNAEAMYYYANLLLAENHLADALTVAQRAVRTRYSLTPAHLLVANIEIRRNHRYQALLPLMTYMLMTSDMGREESLPTLRKLWRDETLQLDLLGTRTAEEPFSELMEKKITELNAENETPSETSEYIRHIAAKTDSLLSIMRDMGEENLDFWQVNYGDFLIELHARGYVYPMTYLFFSSTYNTETLLWVNENLGLFNEFRIWAEGRIGIR